MKKTKIVASIGLASGSKDTLSKLIKSGLNVARINFSHGTHESNGAYIDAIKALRQKNKLSIGIMADLQGPRIRTMVDKDLEIKSGELITVDDISIEKSKIQLKNKKVLGLDVPGIIKDIAVGNDILIEDGLMRVKVVEKKDNYLVAQVEAGGIIKNHKGVNIPDAKLNIPAVTEKDIRDLEFVLKKEVDFVALSFVSNGKEINETREKMKKKLNRDYDIPHIVAKIERKEAIKNIDEIISATDAIMVARGDLGIELPETKVIIYQKELIIKCLKAGKPVIVATQMLNSMIENPLPTRAEVSDVSNAVIDHTDAVMLSGESANGKYPVESVKTMAQIIIDTEESVFDDYVPCHISIDDHMCSDYAPIISSAVKLAKTSGAKAILAISQSGFTARMLSNFRPTQKILVATGSEKTYHQLSLVWGVEPYLFIHGEDMENYLELMIEKAKKEKKLAKGDKLVVVLGRLPGGEMMRLVGIKEIS